MQDVVSAFAKLAEVKMRDFGVRFHEVEFWASDAVELEQRGWID